jgi:putative membrane protein
VLACEMGSMFGGSWLMWFPSLLVVGSLIAFGMWAVGRFPRQPDAPLRILQERLARGEIDAEEFERRRATLEASR